MKHATSDEDLRKVNAILTASFASNPSALWVIKKDDKVLIRLKALIDYAIKVGVKNNGVFLSDDETTAAICFHEPAKTTFSDYWGQLKLIHKAIGWPRLSQVLRRESYLKKIRPDIPFLNFWFLGVDPKHKGSGGVYDIKKGIFQMALQHKIPILLETSVARNKDIYEYFGFTTYHEWRPDSSYILWFMRMDY